MGERIQRQPDRDRAQLLFASVTSPSGTHARLVVTVGTEKPGSGISYGWSACHSTTDRRRVRGKELSLHRACAAAGGRMRSGGSTDNTSETCRQRAHLACGGCAQARRTSESRLFRNSAAARQPAWHTAAGRESRRTRRARCSEDDQAGDQSRTFEAAECRAVWTRRK